MQTNSSPSICTRVLKTLFTIGWLLTVFCLNDQALGQNRDWTNSVDGSWFDATKWTPNLIPNNTDTARFNAGGNYEIEFAGSTLTVGGIDWTDIHAYVGEPRKGGVATATPKEFRGWPGSVGRAFMYVAKQAKGGTMRLKLAELKRLSRGTKKSKAAKKAKVEAEAAALAAWMEVLGIDS